MGIQVCSKCVRRFYGDTKEEYLTEEYESPFSGSCAMCQVPSKLYNYSSTFSAEPILNTEEYKRLIDIANEWKFDSHSVMKLTTAYLQLRDFMRKSKEFHTRIVCRWWNTLKNPVKDEHLKELDKQGREKINQIVSGEISSGNISTKIDDHLYNGYIEIEKCVNGW